MCQLAAAQGEAAAQESCSGRGHNVVNCWAVAWATNTPLTTRILDSRGLSGLIGWLMRTLVEGPVTGVRPSTSPWHTRLQASLTHTHTQCPPTARRTYVYNQHPPVALAGGSGSPHWTPYPALQTHTP